MKVDKKKTEYLLTRGEEMRMDDQVAPRIVEVGFTIQEDGCSNKKEARSSGQM